MTSLTTAALFLASLADPVPHELHVLHAPLASFGAATTSDAIYVLGGHLGGAHEHSRENLSPRLIRVPLDDPSSWQELDGGVGYQSVALVAHGDELFRIGGMFAANAPDEADDLYSVDEFMRYRADEGDWVTHLELPSERSSHDAIVHDGTLYIFGGWRLEGEDQEWFDEGWALDLDDEAATWQTIEQPFTRRALAVGAAMDHVFVIGGLTQEGQTSDRVDAYDTRTGEWVRVADVPVTAFGATAFGVDEGLYFLGRDGNLWRLTQVDGEWERVTSLALPRFFARLVPAGPGRLAAISGATPQGRTTMMELVSVEPSHAEATVASVSMAFPGKSRQRQASFIRDGELYLFGGNLHAEGHKFEPEDFADEGWAIRLLTGEARPVAPFPARRQSMIAAPLGDDASTVLVGGGYGSDDEGPRSYDELFLYDAELDEWQPADVGLPYALSQFQLLAGEGELWSVGGMAYHPDRDGDFTPGDALYRWSFGGEDGFARAEASLLQPRRAFGTARIGDAVYVVGGMTDGFEVVEVPERVDLATGTTEALPKAAYERISPSVVELGGKLYVASGTTPSIGRRAWNPAVECYDPATGEWTTVVEKLPIPAEYVRLAAWGERLVAWTTAREGRLDVAFITPAGTRPEGGGFRHP